MKYLEQYFILILYDKKILFVFYLILSIKYECSTINLINKPQTININ